MRVTRHIGIAGRVNGDVERDVIVATADEGRVEERASERVELSDEDIGAARVRLGGVHDRKVRRGRVAGDVGAAGCVHRKAAAGILTAPAEVGRVREHGIDDKRHGQVVLAHVESDDSVWIQPVADRADPPFSVDRLIGARRGLAKLPVAQHEYQVAIGIDVQLVGSRVAESDGARIGVRLDDEVEFESPAVAVVDEIHTAIDARIDDPRVRRNVRDPGRGLVADE